MVAVAQKVRVTMNHPDAERWNERFAREQETWLKRPPRSLLLTHTEFLPTQGLALDAAAGVGTDSLFLAQRGLRVIALDISEYALRLTIQRARKENLSVSVAVYDLTRLWLPECFFDVIINFYFLERTALPLYQRALKPEGIIYFETFLHTDPSHPRPEHYLRPGELLQAFQGFEVLYNNIHQLTRPDENTCKVTEQLIAKKPKKFQKKGERS
jgi:tellurite methyltransferase